MKEARVLWIVGGWGNRPDPMRTSADRLQRSLRRLPAEPESYGPWGFWQPNELEPHANSHFERLDIDDINAIENAIETVTERVSREPRSAPGLNIKLFRELVSDPSSSPRWCKYSARVGFVDKRRPFNHIAFDVVEETDERTLMSYMSTLVEAWQPDHLGAVTEQTMVAQGQKPPEVCVGRLTYIRDGIPFETTVLDAEVDVAEADGGRYIRVPGTPAIPSLDHILQVRRALGYQAV